MTHTVRPVDYFHATVHDRPGESYRVLASLAEAGVNLLAFSASPVGATAAHMVLFPEDADALVDYAGRSGWPTPASTSSPRTR
jgi:prephenate dehydratase